jgi:signal peptidase II
LKKTVLPFFLSGLVVAFDQLVKWLVFFKCTPGDTFSLIPYILEFFYLHNNGAAMGILSGMRWVLIAVTALVLVGCVVYLLFHKGDSQILRYGLCLVVGGGIGNLIDRIILGYVIDYMRFPIEWFHYSFNLADCAVCIGAGFIILDLILDIFREKSRKKDLSL